MVSKFNAIIFSFLAFAVFMVISSVVVFAQDTTSIGDATGQIWGLYLQHKGSTMGLILVVVQGLMLLTKTELLSFIKGKDKLVAVTALTLIGAVVSNLISGGDYISILGDTVVMSSLQVILHQYIKPKKA